MSLNAPLQLSKFGLSNIMGIGWALICTPSCHTGYLEMQKNGHLHHSPGLEGHIMFDTGYHQRPTKPVRC
jgi:hypothetical protein